MDVEGSRPSLGRRQRIWRKQSRLTIFCRLLRAAIGLDLPGFIAETPELGFFSRRPRLANAGRQRIVLPTVAAKVPSRTARRTQANEHRRKSAKAGKPALAAKMANGSEHGRMRQKRSTWKRGGSFAKTPACVQSSFAGTIALNINPWTAPSGFKYLN